MNRQRSRHSIAIIFCGVLVMLLIALTCIIYFGQRHFIYFPEKLDPGPAAERFPNAQDVTLNTNDGLTLKTWLVKPTNHQLDIAVLYAPGNGGNRLYRVEVAQAIADLGYTVLLLEYRGYGGNPGHPSEEGLALDARTGAAYLRESGFPASRTIYVGESLGTGVISELAVTDPPAGIVLRSPFTSLVDLAKVHYPWMPVDVLLNDRFDTLSHLRKISAPIIVLDGSVDTLVPPIQSATVASQVRSLFRYKTVEGAGHNDEIWFGPQLAIQVDDLARSVISR